MAKLRYYTISRTVQGPEDATHILEYQVGKFSFYKQVDDVWYHFDSVGGRLYWNRSVISKPDLLQELIK